MLYTTIYNRLYLLTNGMEKWKRFLYGTLSLAWVGTDTAAYMNWKNFLGKT